VAANFFAFHSSLFILICTFVGKKPKTTLNIMAQKAKPVNAKRAAYAKKEEKKGTSVVMWIIGSLIVLGLCYAAWSIYMVA
jgi:hypothetical protein